MWYVAEAVAIVALYTFWPALALYPSAWLRSAVDWIKERSKPDSTGG